MDKNIYKKMAERLEEVSEKSETWSGVFLKNFYTSSDGDAQKETEAFPPPGEFPYTRGIHPNMYRGKVWTQREVCGYGLPEDTNERFHFLAKEGVTGLNVIVDVPTSFGIDPDHPKSEGEVGVAGANFTTIEDMDIIMKDVPQDQVNMSLIIAACTSPVVLAQYIAVAKRRGLDVSKLRGTIQNDPIHTRYCGISYGVPIDLGLKTNADIVEYTAKHVPHWYPMNVNLYDMREQGLTAAEEIGVGFSMARMYIDNILERGLNIDDFAPRMAFYCSSHVDFFEEICKMRAARRLWATIMKDHYGAQKPSSHKFRFGVHTAGCSLISPQPLNNIVRIAYEALAASLGGAQSIHCCSYDEPIALPKEEAQRLAIRTQQILANETGVTTVSDPLGGSYFIESLTDTLEAEAKKVMDKIVKHGGMKKAVESGWLQDLIDSGLVERQRRISSGEETVVGLNAFTETEESSTPLGVHRVHGENITEEKRRRLELFKDERDSKAVRAGLKKIFDKARNGGWHANLIPEMVEASDVGATLGEIMGTMRQAYGYEYDCFNIIKAPEIASF